MEIELAPPKNSPILPQTFGAQSPVELQSFLWHTFEPNFRQTCQQHWISGVILYTQEIAVYWLRNCYGTWISRVILYAWEIAVYSLGNCYSTRNSRELSRSRGNSREFNKLRDNLRQEDLLCFLCHTHHNFRQTKRDSRVFTHGAIQSGEFLLSTTKRRVPCMLSYCGQDKVDSLFQTITVEMCQQQAREVSSCASMRTARKLAV